MPPAGRTRRVLTALAALAGLAASRPLAAQQPAPTATVRFDVAPAGASIEVNGVPISGTSVRVPLGPVRVSVSAPGYRPMTAETVLVRARTLLTIAAHLPPEAGRGEPRGAVRVVDRQPPPASARSGFLTVNSDPAATVRLDGDSVGVTPLVDLSVPPGQYYLRLVRSGYTDAERMVTVSAGGQFRVELRLSPAPAPIPTPQ